MKKTLLYLLLSATIVSKSTGAVLGTDSGANWTTGNWTNAAVGPIGTWYQVVNPGSSLAIGDSSQGGRNSIGSLAFNIVPGIYTNANLGFARSFLVFGGGPLLVGQSVFLDVNFLFSNGTKGVTLEKVGGGVGSELITLWQDWGDPVKILGSLPGSATTVLDNGYQQSLRLGATQLDGSIQISLFNNNSSIYSQTFTTNETIGQIQLFAGNIDPAQEGDSLSQSIFVNNISVVPETSTFGLCALGCAFVGLIAFRRRKSSR